MSKTSYSKSRKSSISKSGVSGFGAMSYISKSGNGRERASSEFGPGAFN